ncbi:MAG: hypothetical protein HY744_06305 [Deltaproteobacteria bacterium]|nr:hypothetical protein [Deltaproteobacteria bacterium]
MLAARPHPAEMAAAAALAAALAWGCTCGGSSDPDDRVGSGGAAGQAGPGGSGRGAPAVCSAGRADCDGKCVDLGAHPAHCGGCGQPCLPGEICAAGEWERSSKSAAFRSRLPGSGQRWNAAGAATA